MVSASFWPLVDPKDQRHRVLYIYHLYSRNGDKKAWRIRNSLQMTAEHGLRTPNEGINQRYLKNWADVAGKICFGRT